MRRQSIACHAEECERVERGVDPLIGAEEDELTPPLGRPLRRELPRKAESCPRRGEAGAHHIGAHACQEGSSIAVAGLPGAC